jgi:hypothetical protein
MPNSQEDVTAGAPNPESYTDNQDGTVTDSVTGLMWQQSVPTTKYTWADAVAYCPTLTLAGRNDWRLPSRIELVSIVDPGQASPPSIGGTYFPSTPVDPFWSSSLAAGYQSSSAWYVGFNYGVSGTGQVSDLSRVRCVRSASADVSAPPWRYVVDSTNGAVFDTKTKLTWQRERTASSTKYLWADAKTYCAGVGTGWRLPTIKELQTIVDHSRIAPSINQAAFLSAPTGSFWSSSSEASYSPYAWYVDFGIGLAGTGSVSEPSYVRCVR